MTGLQQEIGKQEPFELAEQEAFLNLVRTSSFLAAEFARLFRSKGLSETTYNILRILRGAGAQGRLGCEIGRQLITEVPDMTRLLDRLEEMGLARRERQLDDRRMVKIFLTQPGAELLAELDEPVMELHRRQLGHLSATDLKELNRLLVLARAAISR